MRRIVSKEIRLTGAPVGAAVHAVWRAPLQCTVTAVHGLRFGGTTATVNASVDNVNVLAADLTCGNDVFATGEPVGAAGDMDAGGVLRLEVVGGDATAVVIQADIAIDADAEL